MQKKIPISVGITAFLASVLLPLSPTTAMAQVLSQTEEEQNQEAKIFLEEQGVLEPGDFVMKSDGSLYDKYSFAGTAGESVTIILESQEFDTYLILLDTEGEPIAENEDSSNDSNSLLVVTLPRDGTYSVIVNGYNAQSQGRYSLTIRQAQGLELRQAEADRLGQQGRQQYQRGQFALALESWQQELSIRQEVQDRLGEGITRNNIGVVYQNQGKYDQALDYHQQALDIHQEVQNLPGEGTTLNSIGVVYHRQGKYDHAIGYFQQALDIHQEVPDRRGEGVTLNNIGDVYHRQGKYDHAIDYFQQALAIHQEMQYLYEEGTTLNNLGAVYHSLGKYDQALDYFQQTLLIHQELQNRFGEGITGNNIGSVYLIQGKYDQALDYFQQSLAIAKEVENRPGEGTALHNLAGVYHRQGKYKQALDYYQQALAIAKEVRNRPEEGTVLHNLAGVYHRQGKYKQALDYYQQALAIHQEVQDRPEEGRTLNDLGIVYQSLGKYDQALDYFQQALAIHKEVQNLLGEGATLQGMGVVYDSQDKYDQALDYYQQALDIHKKMQNLPDEGTALNNMGVVYDNIGKYEQALDYFRKALAIHKEVQDSSGEGRTLHNLGGVYLSQGKYEQALDYFQQALEVFQEVQDPPGEGSAFHNMGYSLFEQGKFTEAENLLSTAIEIGESLRPEELEDGDKISLFEIHAGTYQKLQEVLIAQNKILPALEIAERGRGQAFVQLLAQKFSTSEQERKITPLTIEEIQSIAQQQKATIVQYSLISPENSPENSPEKLYIWVITPDNKVNFREVNLKLLFPEQDESIEELVKITRESIFKGGLVTRSATDLKKGDRIRFSDDEPGWEAWEVISVNNETQTVTARLPSGGSGTQIERPITDVVEILGEQSSPNTKYEQLQQLYQVLIEPIADLLPTDPKAKVIFIPHRALFSAPFPALQDSEGNYLIEKHTILTAPAIKVLESTYKLGKRGTTAEDILLVGNPTMPLNPISGLEGKEPQPLPGLDGAEKEVKEIAPLFNAQPLIGDRATKATIIEQMPKAKIIHLATHGLLDELRGMGSSIALAPSQGDDGFLTAEEIIEMKLNAELVVLSACDTGRGRITGDGVIGLSRSLVVAGVPSVIVSLWTIPDAPTAELMTEFYRQLQETGDKAQALRQAMLTTMKEDSNPKAWAAFTLIGES